MFPYLFFAAFVSTLWPAMFSPYRVISKLEDHLGLNDKEGSNHLKTRRAHYNPPSNSQQLGQHLSRAMNIAYINMFCLARPIHNPSPILRQYMVGLYPLHFIVNLACLVFTLYFPSIDSITIRGTIINIDYVLLTGILAGVLNFLFFVLFYYPRIFCILAAGTANATSTAATTAKGKVTEKTYSLPSSVKRIDRRVKARENHSFKQQAWEESSAC